MASKKRKSSRGSSNIGCLIFLAGFIILLIIFAIKFPDIKATLARTNFLDLVKQRVTTTTIAKAVPETQPSSSPAETEPIALPPTTTAKSSPSTTQAPAAIIPSAPAAVPAAKTAPAAKAVPVGAASVKTEPSSTIAGQTRQASLFFVKIEEDGVISRREVKRNVPSSDSPLTDAINALIAGPSEGEIRSGLVSLIPRGTRVLSITVRGSTAIIDLSDAFNYNHYGVEGYSAQLRQIVYTATSFPSVQDVQFLVEGKQKEYLGGEGVYIGKPLSRNSF